MLLQLALDAPEHFAVLPQVVDLVDIVEVGTPLLKRFGAAAISTAREMAGDTPILADTKTVDGGSFEAELVFGSGAAFMTVLSVASSATVAAVSAVAETYGAWIVLDTITDSGKPELLASEATLPSRVGYVAVHAPTDMRLAGHVTTSHIEAVAALRARGLRVSLAGGITPESMTAVAAASPEIVVVGSAITQSDRAREVTQWIRNELAQPGRGWPWDAS